MISFLAQDPVTVRALTNPFDYGLAVGTIIVLFAILWYLGRETVNQFYKISAENRRQIQAILADHRSERDEWQTESTSRTAKIDDLCDRMIHALARHEEK
jgi:hypothetical protein